MSYDFALVDGDYNSYTFQTANLITYEVRFTPTPYLFGESHIFASHVYEFSIIVADNPTAANPAFDDRTSHTIAAIFTNFYNRSNELIIIYICDSSDGRQLTRQRKFNAWFYAFVDGVFVKYDDILRDANGEEYPVALIMKERNPHKAQIVSEFIALISGYNVEK